MSPQSRCDQSRKAWGHPLLLRKKHGKKAVNLLVPQVWAGDSWEEPKCLGSTTKPHPVLLLSSLHSQGFPLTFVFPLSSVCPRKAAKGGQLFPNSGPYSELQAHRPKGLACVLEGPLPSFSPRGPLWLRSLKRLKCTPISFQIWDLPELISPSEKSNLAWGNEPEGKGWGELFTSTLAPPGLPSPQAPSITLDCSHPDPYPEIILATIIPLPSIPMEVFSLQGPVLVAQNCSQPHNYERVQRLHFQDDLVLLGRQPVSWQTSQGDKERQQKDVVFLRPETG